VALARQHRTGLVAWLKAHPVVVLIALAGVALWVGTGGPGLAGSVALVVAMGLGAAAFRWRRDPRVRDPRAACAAMLVALSRHADTAPQAPTWNDEMDALLHALDRDLARRQHVLPAQMGVPLPPGALSVDELVARTAALSRQTVHPD